MVHKQTNNERQYGAHVWNRDRNVVANGVLYSLSVKLSEPTHLSRRYSVSFPPVGHKSDARGGSGVANLG